MRYDDIPIAIRVAPDITVLANASTLSGNVAEKNRSCV